jgi:glycosyltransferase involved in cell wall biosynthesis
LRTFFREHPEYRIVHCHMNQMSGLVLKVARECGVKVRISHSRRSTDSGNVLARLYKSYWAHCIPANATHLFAISRPAAQWLFGQHAGKARVIYNGIKCADYAFAPEVRAQVRTEHGIDDKTIVLGNVGNIRVDKNQAFLVDIFSAYVQLNPDSRLMIVGDGPLRPELEQKIAALGLTERTILLGSRSDVGRFYQAFDAFVFTSLGEGFGNVMTEAQTAGLHCVISKDVIPEEVDVGAGLVQRMGLSDSPEAWARTILALDMSSRRDHSQVVRDAGRDVAETTRFMEHFYFNALHDKEHA